MMRAQDRPRINSLSLAGSRPSAGGGLEGGGPIDPTARIRRQNRCKICGVLTQGERVYCSYCVQYVH